MMWVTPLLRQPASSYMYAMYLLAKLNRIHRSGPPFLPCLEGHKN
jgi:hypothetical protein